MNKKTTNNSKQLDNVLKGNIENIDEISLLDNKEFWYWREQLESNIWIVGIKWRGESNGRPRWVKKWHIWYNNISKKLEAHTVWPVVKTLWWVITGIPDRLNTQTYYTGEYVVESGQVYVAIVDPTPWAFILTEWRATRLHNTDVWLVNYSNYYGSIPINPWVLTKIAVQQIETTDATLFSAWDMVANNNWKWLIISKVNWLIVDSNTTLEHYIYVNWLLVASHIDPWLNISITTTWTDSIWWNINATSIINYWVYQKTTELCDVFSARQGDIIEVRVQHNYWWQVQVVWEIDLVQL